MESPGFSDFRNLMDTWDVHLAMQEMDQVHALLNGNGFVFFFKKKGELFGTGEDGRLTFARMKNPDDDDPVEDASFTAISLDAAVNNEKKKVIIGHKELNDVKVMDREDVYAELIKKTSKDQRKKLKNVSPDESDDDQVPSNMDTIGEK